MTSLWPLATLNAQQKKTEQVPGQDGSLAGEPLLTRLQPLGICEPQTYNGGSVSQCQGVFARMENGFRGHILSTAQPLEASTAGPAWPETPGEEVPELH